MENTELKDLVTAIGTGAGDKFNLGGLRYGKIILLMDADADGHHISTLLLSVHVKSSVPPSISSVLGTDSSKSIETTLVLYQDATRV